MGFCWIFRRRMQLRVCAPSMNASIRDKKTVCFTSPFRRSVPAGSMWGCSAAAINTRFYAELQMLRDENSSGIEKPVSLARKNLQILADGENLEGSVLLPLARIERTEAGGYRLDAKFVPPMLNVKGSELLSGILRGLIEVLVARSSQLAGSRRQRNQSLADFSASDVSQLLAALHDECEPSGAAPFA